MRTAILSLLDPSKPFSTQETPHPLDNTNDLGKSLNCREGFDMKKHECEPFKGPLPKGLRIYRKRITDFFVDSDGIWAYLVPGWKREPCDDVHFIHEDTLKEVISGMKEAVKCKCDDCMKYINDFKKAS